MINMMKKTRLCQEFMTTGVCKYGDKCTFAHGQHELRAAPTATGSAQVGMKKTGGAGGAGQQQVNLMLMHKSQIQIGLPACSICSCVQACSVCLANARSIERRLLDM